MAYGALNLTLYISTASSMMAMVFASTATLEAVGGVTGQIDAFVNCILSLMMTSRALKNKNDLSRPA